MFLLEVASFQVFSANKALVCGKQYGLWSSLGRAVNVCRIFDGFLSHKDFEMILVEPLKNIVQACLPRDISHFRWFLAVSCIASSVEFVFIFE